MKNAYPTAGPAPLGELLRSIREKAGCSQLALIREAGWTCEERLCKLEKGRRPLGFRDREYIAWLDWRLRAEGRLLSAFDFELSGGLIAWDPPISAPPIWTRRLKAQLSAILWLLAQPGTKPVPDLRRTNQPAPIRLEVVGNMVASYLRVIREENWIPGEPLSLALLADSGLIQRYFNACERRYGDKALVTIRKFILFADALLRPRVGVFHRIPQAEAVLEAKRASGILNLAQARMRRHIGRALDQALGKGRRTRQTVARHPLLPMHGRPGPVDPAGTLNAPADMESLWLYYCEQSYGSLDLIRREYGRKHGKIKLGPFWD